jgi:predicted signal transduction protein with EAL and GGDEF domain
MSYVNKNTVIFLYRASLVSQLLERMADDMDVCAIADRISKSLTLPILLGTRKVIITGSIGIAMSQPTHEQANDLLRDADVAMYQAKTGGKANFVQFDISMNVEAMERQSAG